MRSNPRPVETSTTFPHQLMNGPNTWGTYLPDDPQKLLVFKHFKVLNRDLTKAFNRQAEAAQLFSKAKGSALPEAQVRQKQEDEQTFERIGGLFDKMMRRSRYAVKLQGPQIAAGSRAPGSLSTSLAGKSKGSARPQVTDQQDGKSVSLYQSTPITNRECLTAKKENSPAPPRYLH